MGDEQVEDGMIEIGDPSVETTAVEPPPRVVIEYRERGVPWMLIPPMIVLSAVAAVMVYHKLAPPPPRVPVSTPSSSIAADPAIASGTPAGPSPTSPVPSQEIPPEVDAGPAPASPFALAMETPSIPAPAPADVPPAGADPERPVDPAPFPRVQGLGFDPKGLVDPVPPVDQAVAPAAGAQERRDPPPAEAAPAIEPGAREQPREVDPDVLPVDPREALRRRQQRAAEARLKAEAERGQFHADLRAICRKSGEKAVPEIEELCKRYGMDVDPTIQETATRMLNGPAAGVDRPVRINLLRSLGFSEPAILDDILRNQGRFEDGTARGGARSKLDLTYQSARLLLSYPPTRVASPRRPAPSPRAAR